MKAGILISGPLGPSSLSCFYAQILCYPRQEDIHSSFSHFPNDYMLHVNVIMTY